LVQGLESPPTAQPDRTKNYGKIICMKTKFQVSIILSIVSLVTFDLIFADFLSKCMSCITIGGRDFKTELLDLLSDFNFQITVFVTIFVSIFIIVLIVSKIKNYFSSKKAGMPNKPL
jgi:hypothetical protein